MPGQTVRISEASHRSLAPGRSRARAPPLDPSRGEASYVDLNPIQWEDIRSVSKERLVRRLGSVGEDALAQVEERLRLLLGI